MHLPYMSPVPLSKVLQSNLQLQVNLLKKGNMFQYEVIPPDLRWLNRVMQDDEARASDLNRKLIFSFFFAIFLIKATET